MRPVAGLHFSRWIARWFRCLRVVLAILRVTGTIPGRLYTDVSRVAKHRPPLHLFLSLPSSTMSAKDKRNPKWYEKIDPVEQDAMTFHLVRTMLSFRCRILVLKEISETRPQTSVEGYTTCVTRTRPRRLGEDI